MVHANPPISKPHRRRAFFLAVRRGGAPQPFTAFISLPAPGALGASGALAMAVPTCHQAAPAPVAS